MSFNLYDINTSSKRELTLDLWHVSDTSMALPCLTTNGFDNTKTVCFQCVGVDKGPVEKCTDEQATGALKNVSKYPTKARTIPSRVLVNTISALKSRSSEEHLFKSRSYVS